MREGVEKKLCENQGGFRSGRGCADKIFCLRMLIEKCVKLQLSALVIFVDFKAAFNSIHRPSMWHILSDYGIPDKYIRLIRCVYDNCEAAILVGGEITDWFRIETGVRQGCVWPLLYGSETWATTNSEEKRLDVFFDNRCLRRILGIKWFHRVRNTTVRERTGQTPASLLLKTRRLKWFGHVSRMGQERLPKALSQWRPENA